MTTEEIIKEILRLKLIKPQTKEVLLRIKKLQQKL
jgi:hypothetical protein|tara:strand:- start:3422 stop:3526 length:105 start_codon:yes stop_codon:yes gene_type:complete